jgi:hypothetical protein
LVPQWSQVRGPVAACQSHILTVIWISKSWKDMEEPKMHVKWKKSIWKDFILYDFNIWHSGKGKSLEIGRTSVGINYWGVGSRNRQRTQIPKALKLLIWNYNDNRHHSLDICPDS